MDFSSNNWILKEDYEAVRGIILAVFFIIIVIYLKVFNLWEKLKLEKS